MNSTPTVPRIHRTPVVQQPTPKEQLKTLLDKASKNKKMLSQAGVDKTVKKEPPAAQNLQPLVDEVSKNIKMLEHKTAEPLPEVMYVDTASPKTRKAKPAKLLIPKETDADVMVVSLLDIKATRIMILNNWRKYTPEKIVTILKEYYTNMRSLAVMLSRLKKDLKRLPDPPNDELKFLTQILLSKKEYNDIRALNNDIRKSGAMSVVE